MTELFNRVFATGGWLGILAAIALAVAYVKDKQVRELQELRADEAKRTALLLHQILSRTGNRKPAISIHEDDEVSDIFSVRDKLAAQAHSEIGSDIRELVERYNRGDDV